MRLSAHGGVELINVLYQDVKSRKLRGPWTLIHIFETSSNKKNCVDFNKSDCSRKRDVSGYLNSELRIIPVVISIT